ncbi:disease resistance protein RPV1 [Arachis duranensis]|uniref:Disease resistance protein RPV1 n=1 Tax=Arachis duranensis TaxID=130453 RepID=A0A6P4DIU3_ARADU|nr:disease resistance protein RPV1 [Arachis duranensis]
MCTEISSTPGAFRLRWDVFLSFRGPDTRHSFIAPLYDALQLRGVRVFRDDDGLERGDEIAPTLLEAIDDSAASIVVLSPNYAGSRWCLEELAKICDSDKLILPVFYGVDPRDVRKQIGPFEEAFRIKEKKFDAVKVSRWRKAMTRVGNRAGLLLDDQTSAERRATLIRELVTKVLKELSNTPLGVAPFTVGLDRRVEELLNSLELKSNGFKLFGLYGMGGVGKTTLAKTLYNNLVANFEHRTFIANVREASSKDNGLVSLQKRIIGDLKPDSSNSIQINDINSGIAAIKRLVEENRVLIVLDDVDDTEQLHSLFGKKEWFYEGSRVIITTRDRKLLLDNNVDLVYEVKELSSTESLQLFSNHAFKRKHPPTQEFLGLSEQIVKLTGGLPLALEVYGSFLFDKRRVEEWVDELEKLKRIQPKNLQDVLKISYDGLDEEEKTVFLDIACLLVQMEMKRDEVVDVERGCGFSAEVAITVLTLRCLIKIGEDNTVIVHDQIKDMGRQIVGDEGRVDGGMRSRLWKRDEILNVLRGNKGTRFTQGITLDFQGKYILNDAEAETILRHKLQCTSIITNPSAFFKSILAKKEKGLTLQTKSFKSMVNLRLLEINNLRMEGKFQFLPSEIKWLQWQGCSFKTLPSDFWSQKFTVLDLSYSNIESLWGLRTKKVPENLKVLNLSLCRNLTSIPDLSSCASLDKLVLERCTSLTSIHESIGSLSALHDLNLSYCSNLKELPYDVSGLKNLENMLLTGCAKLKALPSNMGHMKSLRKLLADNTAIAEIPESIFSLERLEMLVLDGCQNLKRLPNCIGNLTSLQVLSLDQSALEELPNSVGSLASLEILSLRWCQSLTAIPETIGNLISLTRLSVNCSEIKELPSSIGSLSSLKELSAGQCKLLGQLPDTINGLASVVELQLDGTAIANLPDQIGAMIILRKFEMRNCINLKSLPESIGRLAALTTLNISNSTIEELPESIGLLENLVTLNMNKCRMLKELPTSIGKLKELHHLMMEETALTKLPETFGLLSSLMTLEMAKRPHLVANDDRFPAEEESAHHSFQLPTNFCDLTLLNVLDARAWRISGEIPNDFEKLSSLEKLDLSQNNFHSLPCSLKGLSILKRLYLRDCIELRSLPSLPSSLIELNAENCTLLENVSEVTDLECLQELDLTNCVKVMDIPGLESLKSLRRMYLSGCIACFSQVRKRLSKVALRNIRNLSMPGTKFPEWFSRQTVNFTKHKNRELKGIVICIVLSINHSIPNNDMMPGIVDVVATVLKSGKQVYSTSVYLRGVPKTNQEHMHMCRFADFHPLVHFMRDGGTLCVTTRNPLVDKRLELKDSGIHLILEGDDDYGGDESSVEPSLKSVSEKMAEFFNSVEDAYDPEPGGANESED